MARTIVIPYEPRDAFKKFHDRHQRWACLVCHRRAGKTVAAVNDLIRAAITCKTTNPLFGYVAPFRSQAKDIAWGFMKYYSQPIQKATNEAELMVTLMNGARIRLFGADNADAMRGLGFDGIFMDEIGDFRPSVWPTVIRPALSDKNGWGVFAGTPKGKNHFWNIWDDATGRLSKEWYSMMLKASQSRILPPEELQDLRQQLLPDQYLQEMECSFEAAIVGAFYGTEMRELEERGHIRDVPYDPSLSCFTAWDIGHTDDTSIWWFQPVGNELHIVDFFTESGGGPERHAEIVRDRKIKDINGDMVNPHYERHYLPHDAKASTYAANGKTTIEQIISVLGFQSVGLVPKLSPLDGINAARITLPICWFDKTACKIGIEALKQYQREWNEDNKCFMQTPKHDWSSHAADAFRYLSLSWREQPAKRITHSDRPLMVGPQNTATLEDMWAAHKHRNRYQRI